MGKKLAYLWTNNVAPSRPSCAELCVYTKYLRYLQSKITDRKIRLLVLGSTPEFRDWGFDENLDISVVDKSQSYYELISRELRHKNLKETLYIQNWEDMKFETKYDIIIGDLAIGNVNPSLFNKFLQNVNDSLTDEGFFLGKSMIWNENDTIKSPREIVSEYRKSVRIHPYTFINHQLGLYCLDKSSYILNFSNMYNELFLLYITGELEGEIFEYFQNIGWDTEMKFKFFAPSQKIFIELVNQYLNFVKFEHTLDYYTKVFPIYIIKRR